jgi:transcriptional regulator GlxA family with amidase domain
VAIKTITEAKMTEAAAPKLVADIGLLIYPECQLAAIYGLTDLFRIAGDWVGESGHQIRVSHWQSSDDQVVCVWDSHPGTVHKLTHVMVPPSIVMPQLMPSAPAASSWLIERHAAGATLCSICAGAFVLAQTGLINGRRATTHWAFARHLASRFPEVHLADEHLLVDEGDIITAGGILAWADLGLTLVGRILGPAAMLATARFLLIDPPRDSQRPFSQFVARFDHNDDAIRQCQHHIHANAPAMQGTADLARIAGMTGRTFLRRFTAATGLTPVEYLQQVRISKAREALERTLDPIERVAWEVGYSDPAAFRKIFQKLTSLSPAAYRQRFGVATS